MNTERYVLVAETQGERVRVSMTIQFMKHSVSSRAQREMTPNPLQGLPR
jgi:hypothetical protein